MAQPAKRLRIDTSLTSEEADVCLTLQGRGNEGGSGSSVRVDLHAHVLQTYSSYFSARLSKRWDGKDSSSDGGPICIKIQECEDLDAYTRSLQLLYRLQEGTKSPRGSRAVHLFDSVMDAARCMKVADHLQIKALQEAALKYLEGVPWDKKESEFVQETCKQVGFPVETLTGRAGNALDQAARKELLLGLIEEGDSNIAAHDLALKLLENGKPSSTKLVESILQDRFKVLESDLVKARQSQSRWALTTAIIPQTWPS